MKKLKFKPIPSSLKNIPTQPGVYLYRNLNQKVIYVGKAINLKYRVQSYFNKKVNRHDNLVENIFSIEIILLNTELEAFLLEARLIKLYQPKYNIIQKDNKRYLYLAITKDKYPRIIQTRLPEDNTNLAEFYGPFTSSQSLTEMMRMIRKIFPFCADKKCSSKTPCFHYRLGLCPGVDIYPVYKYQQNIQKIRKFLNGDLNLLISDLNKSMIKSSKNQKFEQAQKYKKQIEMIKYLLGRYWHGNEDDKSIRQLGGLKELIVRYQGYDPYLIHRIECYDISNLSADIVVGSMSVFINAEPQTSEYRQFRIQEFKGDPQAIKEVLQRRFRHQEWLYPQIIIVDGGKGQVSSAFDVFNDLGLIGKIGLIGLAKEFETIIIPRISASGIKSWKEVNLPKFNQTLQMVQYLRDEAHRFAQKYYKKLHQKKLFLNG